MRAGALLLAALAAVSCGRASSPAPADTNALVAKAASWLWTQQGKDGGWHSRTYGILKGGQSLTPFVLDALLDVPRDVHATDATATRRAVAFLERHVDDDGMLGRSDPGLDDYPNYATALGLGVLVRLRPAHPLVPRMRAALLAQQLDEGEGWAREHPAYGAWGMGGAPRRPPEPGHVDLSMTRYVLEALARGKGEPDEAVSAALGRARVYLARCRGRDGGFHFSPVIAGANKAGRDGDGFLSYGTATADGLLASRAAGLDDTSAARRWLIARHRTDRVPGIAATAPGTWDRSMRFYYLAASARVLARRDDAPSWRAALVGALRGVQHADGHFVNPARDMKEDDPLIATTLALRALLAAR